jgi:hypothetical protein
MDYSWQKTAEDPAHRDPQKLPGSIFPLPVLSHPKMLPGVVREKGLLSHESLLPLSSFRAFGKTRAVHELIDHIPCQTIEVVKNPLDQQDT